MQAPQLLGVLIGISLIGAGWFLRRFLTLKEKRAAGGVAFAILAYMGALLVLQSASFSYASTWSWRGVFMIWSGFFGTALVPVTFAFLGLVYRPDRVAGYIVALVAFTAFMMVGSK